MLTLGLFVLGLILLGGGLAGKAEEQRRRELFDRYHDWEVVTAIMNKLCWIGQTEQQLTDAIGKPAHTERKTSATKLVEVWKYEQTGKNRFNLRVTLHDGQVAVIDRK